MDGQYLWAWLDRSHRVTVLRLRGELDAIMADEFAAEAARLLAHVVGPVSVDLSMLEFLDCAGARRLAAVLRAIPSWRLVGVSGIQAPVRRVLDLIHLDLNDLALATTVSGGPVLSPRGQELISRSHTALRQSREMLLETSGVMARLATTYGEIALARQQRAAQEHRAEHLQALSDVARDLAVHYRQRALG